MENEQASPWFASATLGSECCYNPPTRCPECEPSGNCDRCSSVDGRFIEEVNVYASTCDRCGDLTHHDLMTMDPETQLGYCKECIPKLSADVRARLEQDSVMSGSDQES